MNLVRVTFEPHDRAQSRVVAEYDNGQKQVAYLDNASTRHFLKTALMAGSVQAGFGVWGAQ